MSFLRITLLYYILFFFFVFFSQTDWCPHISENKKISSPYWKIIFVGNIHVNYNIQEINLKDTLP